jgi:CBS domain-containing protein
VRLVWNNACVLVAGVMSTQVVSVEPDATVGEAIARMMEAHVGAVAVCERSRLVGIFTERDVLRLASEGVDFRDERVGDVMTASPVVASPDLRIVDAAEIMGERKIRHLPVVEGENLLGMIGIRDVLRTLVERVWAEHDAAARETAGQLLRH